MLKLMSRELYFLEIFKKYRIFKKKLLMFTIIMFNKMVPGTQS